VSRSVDGDGAAYDAPPTDPVTAIRRYGRVFVSSAHSGRNCVHLHPHCREAPSPDGRGRTLTHRGELPLRCDDVCSRCRRHNTDEQGRLRPAADDGTLLERPAMRADARRVCGRLDCRRDGLVRIDHPEHGTRVVCPVHQGRHPVEEVFGHDV